jgi:excinuclease ABC subunit C
MQSLYGHKVSNLIDISAKIKEKLSQLPQSPGIYKMLDSKGNIIYIGKSNCLRKRVRTYFTDNPKWEKVKKLVFFIDDIDFIVTDTHLEARLLECELIKNYKPVFNSQMKNDNKYVYLKIENYNKYNPLSIVSVRDEEGYTYGPFRKRHSLASIIDSLKCIFPIINKNGSYEFEYHIFPLTMEKDTFNENRSCLIEIFSDKKKMQVLINTLDNKMKDAASLFKYETASKYRDIVQGLSYINNGIWHYKELMSRDILLKIPIKHGYKLFFISKGNILLKKCYETISDQDTVLFLHSAYSIKPSTFVDIDEKAGIDFRDILYSEILSLPKDMVKYL